MKIATTYIHPNEPAYGLFEGDRKGRWVQAVYVVRGDAIAEYLTDLGKSEDYESVMPLVIPNDGDDSVAALQYLAEQNRHDFYWASRRAQMLSESTLIKDVIEGIDRDQDRLRGRRRYARSS